MNRLRTCRLRLLAIALSAATALSSQVASAAEDILFANFESPDYGAWTATGEAFGPGPATGTLTGQMAVTGFKGERLVNSFFKGDRSTGTLTSPSFKVQRRYISFLIGGGGFEGKTCVQLLVDGAVVRSAVGPNNVPGGSEELVPGSWDVSDLVGKSAQLRVLDGATEGWGHISLDQVVFTDSKPKSTVLQDATREIKLTHRYLHLPVKTGAKSRRLAVLVNGVVVRECDIELADGTEDWWAPMDLAPWIGRTATLRVDRIPEDSKALSRVEQGNSIKSTWPIYQEPLRPQFHFSPLRGWNNDPNGLVFSEGEYHLYYQNNPYGWNWGNMHWAHAVSSDLVHWKEQPIAIYPARYGDAVFSGSAVVDRNNTSGWKKGEHELLVAAFTSTGRGECIVYSNDRGRTWNEYEGNPVVKHSGRDPRLLWYAPGQHWVMALYDEFQGGQYIAFYTSKDLKRWDYQSRIEGFYECPDLFELPLEGQSGVSKWVLTAASSEYRVGAFDGKSFTPETPKLPGHRGDGFYAAQTYSDMPDGRRVQIGWGQFSSPGMPFNQLMCFPCRLTLHATPEGPRLAWNPIRELETLHASTKHLTLATLGVGAPNPLAQASPELADIEVRFQPDLDALAVFYIRGTPVSYNAAKNELFVGKRRAVLKPEQGKVSFRMLCDRTSLEVFADRGFLYMPAAAVKKGKESDYSLRVTQGSIRELEIDVHSLRSAWRR